MPRSSGLRLALGGFVLFAVSILALLVSSHALIVAGVLIGGVGVFAGFIWTIFGYYFAAPPP